MTQPEITSAVDRFRAQLLDVDSAAARRLVTAYLPIWARVRRDVDALLEQATRQQLGEAEIRQLQRFQSIERQIEREVQAFGLQASGTIRNGQGAAVEIAAQGSRAVVNDALPRGMKLRALSEVGIEWNALPADAVANFVGVAGDGQPIGRLLAPLGAEVRTGVAEAITEGIARGFNPNVVAEAVRERTGMGLTRALRISRTEILRSYREANRATFQANSAVVKGYRRHADQSERTCFACIALDGKLYGLDEPLDEHVQGRCSLEPVTISYRDLGLDVDDARPTRQNARDWFMQQNEVTQRSMMGNRGFEAWKGGQFTLEDMARVEHSDTWGNQAVQKPLKALIMH